MPSKTEQHPDAIVRGVIEASNFALSADEARELIAAAVATYNKGGKSGVFRQVKIAAERAGLEPEDYDDAASWLQQNVGSFNLARFGRESKRHEQQRIGNVFVFKSGEEMVDHARSTHSAKAMYFNGELYALGDVDELPASSSPWREVSEREALTGEQRVRHPSRAEQTRITGSKMRQFSEGYTKSMARQKRPKQEQDDRATLERQYGQVWDTSELQRDFSVEGFGAPFVVVRRKSDGQRGSLQFQHQPRFYFDFTPTDL